MILSDASTNGNLASVLACCSPVWCVTMCGDCLNILVEPGVVLLVSALRRRCRILEPANVVNIRKGNKESYAEEWRFVAKLYTYFHMDVFMCKLGVSYRL